jgi:small acid-soluble spore protein I (minor)
MMLNFNIRDAVIRKINKMSNQELHSLIEDSIQQKEEKLLPGLGILFELIWQGSTSHEREQMVHTLQESLSRKP